MNGSDTVFEFTELSAGYGDSILWENFNFKINKGDFVVMAGPNGSGKSTLLKYVAGFNTSGKGRISFFGKNINSYSTKELAILRSYVSQNVPSDIPFTLEEIVFMGAEAGSENFYVENSTKKVTKILEDLNLLHLKHRAFSSLSGGERQKTLLARAFAQSDKVLLLDEPDASLDPGQAADFFRKLAFMAEKNESTVIVITHNLDAAVRFFPKMILLGNDKKILTGTPAELLRKYGEKIYGVKILIGNMAETGNYALVR